MEKEWNFIYNPHPHYFNMQNTPQKFHPLASTHANNKRVKKHRNSINCIL
jgi:hypothetical protein